MENLRHIQGANTGLGETEFEFRRLLRRIAGKDKQALKVLYDLTSPRLWAFFQRTAGCDLAEDLLKEVFVQIWKSAGSFDALDGGFYQWIFATVLPCAFNTLPSHNSSQLNSATSRILPNTMVAKLAPEQLTSIGHNRARADKWRELEEGYEEFLAASI